MSSFRLRLRVVCVGFVIFAACVSLSAQEAPSTSQAPASSAPEETSAPPAPTAMPDAAVPGSHYDKAMFLKPIPSAQLDFIKGFAGASSYDLFRDKQFRKLMKSFVPDCMFHYGRDKPLSDALDEVFDHSREPVEIREGRYVLLSGMEGKYLSGRGFLWIDLQDGIGMGAFFFHPTNGEPTPALNVFSRQVKEDYLSLSELPPAFAEDLGRWSETASVAPVTIRYFLTGANKKLLLEHDEDFCQYQDGSPAPPDSGCEEMNASAADFDLTAAEYTEETHHATNATAWMLNGEDQAWFAIRDRRCGGVVDPLGCRILVTHERIRVITGRRPIPRR